jgi:murein DD-endopeptidase MepM/ murein hydrolase activator NlpD
MRPVSVLGGLALLLLPTHLPQVMDVPPVTPREALTVYRGIVPPNSSLAAALHATISPASVHQLVEAARPVYDLARLSVGHPFGIALGPDGLVAAFTYGIDELRTLRVRRHGDELSAEVLTRSYDVRVGTVAGEIQSSLFGAVEDAGEQDQLALDLADIFAWDVDFNTELQKGDSFRAAVEKLYLDGRFSRYGRVLAAELVRGDRTLRAVRYEGIATTGYFAPDGTPLRKAFLRSPLRFSRITSGFSRARLHPILHTVRPHLGVDLAAPSGTPVMAVGDGVVASAGWDGGFGNAIRLRHANGFATLYGHLSRIHVRVGQRVSQGDVIGAVGMTGLATGPHLDYRMVKSGVFVNPLRTQSPPADPVPPAERAAFERERDRAMAALDVGASPRGPQHADAGLARP